MTEFTYQNLLDYNDHESNYLRTVGEFIVGCNNLENFATHYVVKHYVNVNDKKELDIFMDKFIVRQDMTLQRVVKTMLSILRIDHESFLLKNDTILNEKIFSELILFRNILAHSSFIDTNKFDHYHLHWFTKDERIKKYKKSGNHTFHISKKEFEINLKKLRQINNLLLMNLV